LASLAQINVNLRLGKPAGRTSLHFDEAQDVLVVTHDVDLHHNGSANAIASYRDREISSNDAIPHLFEISDCEFFPASTKI
jgi:hypothetical protein